MVAHLYRSNSAENYVQLKLSPAPAGSTNTNLGQAQKMPTVKEV